MKFFSFLLFSLFTIQLSAQTLTFTAYFDFDSAQLTSEEVNKLTSFLKANPQLDILEVKGFTDPKGKITYNNYLAEERIKTVGELLMDKEFKQTVIGENYPQKTTLAHDQLRKVEITYRVIEIVEEKPIAKETKPEVIEVIEVEKAQENNRFEELTSSSEEVSIDLDVKFVGGEAILLRESHADLESFYTFLETHGEINILIRGHVCCYDDYELSVKRAQAIYNYLVQKGIDATRLTYKGYSNKMPKVSPERDEADRIQNRRVDVVVVK